MVESSDRGGRLAVYRFSFREIVRPALQIGCAVGSLAAVRGWVVSEGMATLAIQALGAAVAAIVVSAMIFTIASFFFGVEVFERGMRGQGRSGRSVFVRWSDISRVERRVVWGAPYAEVVSHSGGDMWLPLWIVRDGRFREIVKTHREGADPFEGVV
jgi:hypothetical protein